MTRHASRFMPRLATTPDEVSAAQALRYEVFVEEMGVAGALTDHADRVEADRFDASCEHLLLLDAMRGGEVVGAYRLMTEEGAARVGGFATEEEFDIAPLRRLGQPILELGRSCVRRDHRGGAAMHVLWQALAGVVAERGIGVLFGLASLPGTDLAALAQPLALLRRDYLAPEALRPTSRDAASSMLPAGGGFDRRAGALALPALVKAYLRLGGRVGQGAFVDRTFGCVDVCMVLPASGLSDRAMSLYGQNPHGG